MKVIKLNESINDIVNMNLDSYTLIKNKLDVTLGTFTGFKYMGGLSADDIKLAYKNNYNIQLVYIFHPNVDVEEVRNTAAEAIKGTDAQISSIKSEYHTYRRGPGISAYPTLRVELPVLKSTVNESYSAAPNRDRLGQMLDDGVINAHTLASELLSWLSDDDVAEFARAYDYFSEVDDEE